MKITLDTGTQYELSDSGDVNRLKDNLRKMGSKQQWERIKVVLKQVKPHKKYQGKSISYNKAKDIYNYAKQLLANEEIYEHRDEKREHHHKHSAVLSIAGHVPSSSPKHRFYYKEDVFALAEQMEGLAISKARKANQQKVQGYHAQNMLGAAPSAAPLSAAGGSLAAFVVPEIKQQQFNWKDVACAGNQYDWLTRPTGQIVSVGASNAVTDRFCSGTIIGKDYFLTAGHCLGNVCYALGNYPGNYKISFNYQHSNCAADGAGAGATHEWVCDIQEVVEHGICEGVDYAIFKLHPYAQQYFGSVQLCGDMPSVGEQVVLAHHPEGNRKVVSEGKVTTSGVVMTYSDGNGGKLSGDLTHTAHTLGGSSGAAIGIVDRRAIAAVHVAGDKAQTVHTGISINALVGVSETLQTMPILRSARVAPNTNLSVTPRIVNQTPHPLFGSLQQPVMPTFASAAANPLPTAAATYQAVQAFKPFK